MRRNLPPMRMKNESKQYECSEQWDTTSLIPDQFGMDYVKKCGLGHYYDDILQDLRLTLQVIRNRGLSVSDKYAFGILRNKVRDKIKERDRKREFKRSIEDLAKTGWGISRTDCPADVAERKELSEKVQGIISDLPWRLKVVIRLKLCEKKLTFREIGDVIKMSEATARDDYRRGLEFVRRRLDAAEAGESESNMIPDTHTPQIEKATSIGGRNL